MCGESVPASDYISRSLINKSIFTNCTEQVAGLIVRWQLISHCVAYALLSSTRVFSPHIGYFPSPASCCFPALCALPIELPAAEKDT